MAGTRNRRERNKTKQRKSRNHLGIETTRISKTTQNLSRCNTIHGTVPSETTGKNRLITKITEEKKRQWKWETDQENDFETIKKMLTEEPG